jgi:hypothetical protein
MLNLLNILSYFFLYIGRRFSILKNAFKRIDGSFFLQLLPSILLRQLELTVTFAVRSIGPMLHEFDRPCCMAGGHPKQLAVHLHFRRY